MILYIPPQTDSPKHLFSYHFLTHLLSRQSLHFHLLFHLNLCLRYMREF